MSCWSKQELENMLEDVVNELEEAWTEGTQEGTDHRFRGITTCPKCGFKAEYEDGSL